MLVDSNPNPHDVDTNLLTRLEQCISDNRQNRDKMLREIQLLDSARNQSYGDYLDQELVSWLDS
jgi:hypothetical protein